MKLGHLKESIFATNFAKKQWQSLFEGFLLKHVEVPLGLKVPDYLSSVAKRRSLPQYLHQGKRQMFRKIELEVARFSKVWHLAVQRHEYFQQTKISQFHIFGCV
jgi:hypothetical protein